MLIKYNTPLVSKATCIAIWFSSFIGVAAFAQAPADSTKQSKVYKNVIRYNLSSALLFGPSKYLVFGYERTIRNKQSFSINLGPVALPKLLNVETDSFRITKDLKSGGFNFSVDYRFYLPAENKHIAPRGVYLGPYASFNHFQRENKWLSVHDSDFVNTTTEFNITTVGFQIGYQFILWKRFALDFLMIGPGIGFYDYKTTIDANVDEEKKQQLYDALSQIGIERIPGMGQIISPEDLEDKGTVKTTNIGYRYIIHIGYLF